MLFTFAVTSLVMKICNALLAALVRIEINFLVRIIRSDNQITFVLNIPNRVV